ncbi:MAG: hypothetical protein HYV96_11060 [Opitutae bacterium]|nr:hypothetical protein [Opitutae bacterium]
MTKTYRADADSGEAGRKHIPHVEADYSSFDTAEEIIRDAARWGILERLRELLCGNAPPSERESLRVAKDIAYELAGAKDRSRAVDVFIHATGIAEYEIGSLRDYASRHGVSHEWFRQEVEAMRTRLNLPPQKPRNEL